MSARAQATAVIIDRKVFKNIQGTFKPRGTYSSMIICMPSRIWNGRRDDEQNAEDGVNGIGEERLDVQPRRANERKRLHRQESPWRRCWRRPSCVASRSVRCPGRPWRSQDREPFSAGSCKSSALVFTPQREPGEPDQARERHRSEKRRPGQRPDCAQGEAIAGVPDEMPDAAQHVMEERTR